MPDLRESHGFPRTVRLLKGSDFGRVFDDARPFGAPAFTILARPNGLGTPRIGLVIGKKKIRRSVDRNLVKRIVRESFRLHRQQLPAVDLVFIARPQKLVDTKALHTSLQKQWRRIAKAFPPERDHLSEEFG